MDNELLKKRFQELRKHAVTYERLMSMSEDDCVKVNISYFNYLIVRIQMLGVEDDRCWEIFNKYIELDDMQRYVNDVNFVRDTYYLMSVAEIKYLITTLNDVPWFDIVLIESSVKTDELEQRHDDLRKRYNSKKDNPLDKESRIFSVQRKK